MSGNVCSYYGCEKSYKLDPGLRKFRFPIRDISRCEQWVKNSGKNIVKLNRFLWN